MAGNQLTLHTNDKVVVTTSRGNQEKWFDAEKNLWYKVDDGCFEALAEAVSSEVLRNFTNAVQLPGISVANYWVDTAEVHGLKRVVSVSENFKREDESLITANTILKNSLGTGYLEEFNRRTSLKERIRLLVDAMEEATGMQDMGEYLQIQRNRHQAMKHRWIITLTTFKGERIGSLQECIPMRVSQEQAPEKEQAFRKWWMMHLPEKLILS